jgi:serine/threonine-protein kinase RsbW
MRASPSHEDRSAALRHELILGNDLRELRRMSAWLDSTGNALGIDEDLHFKFDLCANEVVTNIISYAFADAGAHRIRLCFGIEAEKAFLEFEDDGRAFDPLAAAAGNRASSLDAAEIGGWGLQLVSQMLSDSRYERRRETNVLRLSARLPERSRPSTAPAASSRPTN